MSAMPPIDFDERPFVIIWEVTRACALACRHCRAEAVPDRHPRELDFEESLELIDQVVRESLRFSPVLTFIRRYAIRDTQLSQASGGAVLRRGSRILVGLSTAMFDATAFPNPNDFRLDRPAERYLHFGTGLHQCYGQRFAEMFLRKMVTGLVAQKILVGARTESSIFDSWALTNYRISLAGGRACKT